MTACITKGGVGGGHLWVNLRGLAALLDVAAFADGFGLLVAIAEVAMHQTAVALPPAAVFGVLDA